MKRFFGVVMGIGWLLAWGSSSWGATKPHGFELRVIYGDKISVFEITPQDTGGEVKFHNNEGGRAKHSLTAANFEYLTSILQKIPMKQEATSQCERSQLLATWESSDKKPEGLSACLFGKSPTAQGLQDMANLLATVL